MKNLQSQKGKIESTALFILNIIVLTLLIIPATILRAQDTSADKIKGFAEKFLLSQQTLKSGVLQPRETIRTLELQQLYQSPDSALNPLHCYQNNIAGFAIVSENGGNYVIVGYSSTANFDPANIPETLKKMLKTYEQTASFTINTPNNLKSGSIVVTPLLDQKGIHLNQYNHENVGNCPTGCVATAMVQIMCYYKYPATGMGSNSYTHPVYGVQSADFGNTTYNWTNMTEADYKLLSFHVGVAMNMNYCADSYGSSPSAPNYENTLQKYFKYNVHYGTSESFYLKSELDNNRPVYSSLYGDPSHAVVIDGYDSDGFFHLNFGWGGSANGFYLMNNNTTMDVVGYIFGTNIGTSLFISPTAPKTNQLDSLALVSFHNSMNGKTGWDLTKPVVNWPGVLVMNDRVIRINLTNALEGAIPSEIGNLSALQSLIIKGNITGPFPIAVTNLTALKELSINYFSNTSNISLPAEIGNLVNLESLNITKMVGSIPKTIGNLTKLKSLALSGGGLTGGFPDEFYSLTNLENLQLGNNLLTGSISLKIGQLTKLKTIELHNNQLSGELPAEIGNLTELITFRITQNKFSGTVPESIASWTKLNDFFINDNSFTGMLPNAIGKFTNLLTLYVDNNKFTSLPDSLGNLTNLQQIDANTNLIGSIPASINKLSKLYRLDLMNNKLTTLPDLGTMPALWDLNLSYNQLTVLPESFCKLVKVSDLHLDNNQLTELPSNFENLIALKDVSINENRLTSVPISLSLLTNLKHLYLQNNQISGALPPLNHLGLMDLNVRLNKLIFSDIAASLMPDDTNYTDSYEFNYYDQAKVAITDTLFNLAQGDSLSIDIRKISRLSHPNDVYNWYKDNQPFQTGAVLKFPSFAKEQQGSYFCRVTNTKYTKLLVLETNTLKIVSKGDSIYTDGFHTTSRANASHEISDYQVTLTVPDGLRGTVNWQASLDSINWYVVSDTLSKPSIKQNIVSITGTKVLIMPKLPLHFRYVVKEEACNPLFSDVIKVKPYGVMLVDTMLNVRNNPVTISKDSIEIIIPAGFTDKDFRLTINKLPDKPAAPDSVQLKSVYDVNLSCGSVFDVPMLIKFKNINKQNFNEKDINRYQAVYYDDQNKRWERFKNARLSLKDSCLVFETYHLTKLSWWYDEEAVFGYTDVYTRNNIRVVYKDGDLNFFDLIYKKEQTPQTWHEPPGSPEYKTPWMIQDVAKYLEEVIVKLRSLPSHLDVPDQVFTVYVTEMDADGVVGWLGMAGDYLTISRIQNSPDDLRSLLAHEYMHYTQAKYIVPQPGNIFWYEATAHLTDRLVWDASVLPVSESDNYLLDGRTAENSIFNFLANSWDYWDSSILTQNMLGNLFYCYSAGTFIHYMRSYRVGDKLQPDVLLTEVAWTGSWLNYLDSYVKKHLNSNVGNEYEGFIKYIIEGSNENFTLLNKTAGQDPLKYFSSASDKFVTKKIFKFNNEKVINDKVQLEIPYLATKMVQIYNGNLNQKLIIRYKRNSEKKENLKAFVCKYDSDNDKMTFEDISGKDSSTFVIEKPGVDKMERKHIAFLLFINKDQSESANVDYDLKAYNIPEYSMLDDFSFFEKNFAGTSGGNLAIHTISDGSKETLSEFYMAPQVYRRFQPNHPLSYSSELTDSTYITYATSQMIDQTVTYNFLTGAMTIHDKENWGGLSATSPYDMREITMVLGDVWLTPDMPNQIGITYSFNTNSTTETQKVIKSISYVRKHAWWNEHLEPPGLDPIVTDTYLRTNYNTDNIILHLQFW
jgi:Leucine-rich repeat (LRR) protein